MQRTLFAGDVEAWRLPVAALAEPAAADGVA
jgi:hypothetical protein